MSDLIERYNGIEADPEGVYVMFEDYERLTKCYAAAKVTIDRFRKQLGEKEERIDELEKYSAKRVDKWMQLMVEKDERIEKLEDVRAMAKVITDGFMIRSAYWEEENAIREALQEAE